MARRWRARILPPGAIQADLVDRRFGLRYAAWFDPATELPDRQGWAVQYEEIDGVRYRRGGPILQNMDPGGVSFTRLTVQALHSRNPCQEIVLEFTVPDPREPRHGT